MNRLVHFLALIAVVSATRREPKIANGHEADILDFPYMASLQMFGEHFCAGAIIKADRILTAAHCLMYGRQYMPFWSVRVGSTKWYFGGNEYRVQDIKICEFFKDNSGTCDVGIVSLTQPLVLSAWVWPVQLATEEEKPKPGQILTVTGWGVTEHRGRLSNTLKTTKVPAVNLSSCSYVYRGHGFDDTMTCAGDGESGGTLPGDSGGPLVNEQRHLVGIASRSMRTIGVLGYPDVYADVTNRRVLKFIVENAWPELYLPRAGRHST